MLLGQQLGRCHERRLVLVLEGHQHRQERHHGFPRPDVAHQQPVHPFRRRHVGGDLGQRLLLIAGQRPGQRLTQPPGERGIAYLRQAALVTLGQCSRARQHELHVEQLIEREASPSEFCLGGTGRTMHHAERIGQRRQAKLLAARRRQEIGNEGNECVEMSIDEGADLPVTEPLGRGINGEDQPLRRRFGIVRLAQDDELARRHLSPVIEAHRPGHEQQLPFANRAVEKCLARPHALEEAGVVAQHRVENAQTFSRREHPLRHDPSHRGDFVTHACPREWRERRGIEIAMGEVPHEVERGADPEAGKRVGPLFSHPLQELDRGVGLQGGTAR